MSDDMLFMMPHRYIDKHVLIWYTNYFSETVNQVTRYLGENLLLYESSEQLSELIN